MNVQFRNSFKFGPSGGFTEQIVDDKFWDFLDELIALKNRLESAQVSINSNWRNYIVVTFIQKAKVEGDLFTIQKYVYYYKSPNIIIYLCEVNFLVWVKN